MKLTNTILIKKKWKNTSWSLLYIVKMVFYLHFFNDVINSAHFSNETSTPFMWELFTLTQILVCIGLLAFSGYFAFWRHFACKLFDKHISTTPEEVQGDTSSHIYSTSAGEKGWKPVVVSLDAQRSLLDIFSQGISCWGSNGCMPFAEISSSPLSTAEYVQTIFSLEIMWNSHGRQGKLASHEDF